MDQRLIDLYHDYAHVHFDRRVFLEKAAKIVGSASAAAALLPLLAPDDAKAAIVAPDDQRVTASRVTFTGVTGEVKAYLAKPKAAGRYGAVEVVHAVGGISPHIEDICRRLAVDGFIALGVDFLSPLGGTPVPRNPEVAALTRSLKPEETTGNAVAAARYLRSLPESNGKTGAVGFCWGGGVVNRLAVADPMLTVGVPFYGAPPPSEDVPKIKAAMLINFADPELDKNLGMLAPVYEEALKKAGVRYEMRFYPGAQHAFNDDTGQRYHPEAAKLAWSRTVAAFKSNLS
jgi:carboxymethylenebutenolidase